MTRRSTNASAMINAALESKLRARANFCREIVIDGVGEAAAGEGVVSIAVGNDGRQLRKFAFKMHDLA